MSARVLLRDFDTRAPVGELVGWESIDIPFDMRGPLGTSIVVPARGGQTHHSRLRPGSSAALVEIDARGAGVPLAWLGQAESWGEALGEPKVDLSLGSPEGWLGQMAVHDWPAVSRSAGGFLVDVIGAHTGSHHLELGVIEDGAAIDIEGGGLTLWELLSFVEENSDLETALLAIPGAGRLRVSARHPFSAPRAVGVALALDVNCAEVDLGGKLPTNAAEVIGVAHALLKGAGAQSMAMQIPAGPVIGRAAALGIQASPAVAAQVTGGPVILTPDTPSLATLEAQLAAEVRRLVAPVVGGTAVITEPELYPHMVPGMIVSTRFDDALGYWGRSLARIRTVTWTLAEGPPAAVDRCRVSFDLWALE